MYNTMGNDILIISTDVIMTPVIRIYLHDIPLCKTVEQHWEWLEERYGLSKHLGFSADNLKAIETLMKYYVCEKVITSDHLRLYDEIMAVDKIDTMTIIAIDPHLGCSDEDIFLGLNNRSISYTNAAGMAVISKKIKNTNVICDREENWKCVPPPVGRSTRINIYPTLPVIDSRVLGNVDKIILFDDKIKRPKVYDKLVEVLSINVEGV